MRKNIVAGNWKMHKNQQETIALLEEIIANHPKTATEIVV
ncbi:MAG: triose-phosphate isomerase, partial [Flavobacterium sp.]|nr:triose-phosphate isomerase [Flavobacterium sp.]